MPTEQRLQKFADHIWICEQDQQFMGLELGARMTIVDLGEAGLLVHSPIRLTEQIQNELQQLGEVRVVVAPNQFHHLYLQDFKQAYPLAKFFAAPGLETKRSDFIFDQVITTEKKFPWSSKLQHLLVQGTPKVNEVVFFHPQSRTLLLTDLALNIQSSKSAYAKFVLTLIGTYKKFGLSAFERLVLVRDHVLFAQSIEQIGVWDFDKIIMAHGEVITNGGKSHFQNLRPKS